MLNVQKDVVLAPFTTFHIGGSADYFVEVTSKDELVEAVLWAKEKSLDFFLLGSGANILIGDKGYRGLVIKNECSEFTVHNLQLIADSGAVIADIIDYAASLGLSGFEHFAGIPSTIGGALWQNLHFLSPDRSHTLYIADILEKAEILSEEGERKDVGREYFNFGYDYSTLHKRRDIVLSATFSLSQKTPEEVNSTVESNLAWRAEKHPEGAVWKSAGSIFKKIEGHGAGRLIQEVGLKGHQIGGAKISDKHANFILNEGGATAKDVRELINLVIIEVKHQLGLDMETEISFVGDFS